MVVALGLVERKAELELRAALEHRARLRAVPLRDYSCDDNDGEDDFDDDDAPASARGHVAHIVADISRKHTREKLVALAVVSAITIGIIRHRGRVQKASAHDPWR